MKKMILEAIRSVLFLYISLFSMDIVKVYEKSLLYLGTFLIVAFISIISTCEQDPHQGVLVVAAGSFFVDSSEHGINWSPAETKGQMTFNEVTCRYEKIVQRLPTNINYEWKVAFNGKWGDDKGCNNNGNCQFNSGSSGAVLLIYNPYTAQLTTSPLNGDQTTTPSSSISISAAICGDGICESNETHQICPQDCPNDLPGCDIFPAESCLNGTQFHANPGVDAKRWQAPKPGSDGYRPSYQDYYVLVGYADIIYTDTDRRSANVCLQTIYRYSTSVIFSYFFDGVAQNDKCKLFTSTYTGILEAVVTASDGSTLKLPEIDFIWNSKQLVNRTGDYRNGQKGAVAEMFGWPHQDVEQECEFLSKAGYLGVKIFPVHEQLMSTQPMENAMNPWYFM
jgi:hypothetical protein